MVIYLNDLGTKDISFSKKLLEWNLDDEVCTLRFELLKAKDVDYDTTSVKIYYRVIPNGQWKQWDETDDRLTRRYFAFGALKYEARVHLKGELKGGNKKGIIHGKDATIQYVILDRKEPAP